VDAVSGTGCATVDIGGVDVEDVQCTSFTARINLRG
jgi:hypothetical protein